MNEKNGDYKEMSQEDSSNPSESTLKSAAEIAADRCAVPTETSDVVSISQKELDQLRAQAGKTQEHWDRLLRTQADFENFKKRMERERQEWIRSANEKLLRDLIVPMDHFEMGLQSAQSLKEENSNDSLRHGMEMVFAQFQHFWKSHHVTEIQAVGQKFDPALHEAVAHQESDLSEGQVIQQTRKGYQFKDRVLRPASVIVSKGKSEKVEETSCPEKPIQEN